MTRGRTIEGVREAYHETLNGVHDACEQDGLIFPEVMRHVLDKWLDERNRMRNGEPINETLPPKARRIVQSGSDFQVCEGEAPAPPKNARFRKGPTVETLAALRPGQYIKVPPGVMKLSSMKPRVSNAKKIEGCSPTLVCWETEEGAIIVRP